MHCLFSIDSLSPKIVNCNTKHTIFTSYRLNFSFLSFFALFSFWLVWVPFERFVHIFISAFIPLCVQSKANKEEIEREDSNDKCFGIYQNEYQRMATPMMNDEQMKTFQAKLGVWFSYILMVILSHSVEKMMDKFLNLWILF